MLTPDRFTMKQNDNPTVGWQVRDHGIPVDLTGATAVLRYRRGAATPGEIVLDVVAGVGGLLEHQFTEDLPVGTYLYTVRFLKDDVEMTAPTVGTGSFTVEAGI